MWTQSEDFNSDFDKYESYLVRQDKKYCPISKELDMITHLIAGKPSMIIYNYINNFIKNGDIDYELFKKRYFTDISDKYFSKPV